MQGGGGNVGTDKSVPDSGESWKGNEIQNLMIH